MQIDFVFVNATVRIRGQQTTVQFSISRGNDA